MLLNGPGASSSQLTCSRSSGLASNSSAWSRLLHWCTSLCPGWPVGACAAACGFPLALLLSLRTPRLLCMPATSPLLSTTFTRPGRGLHWRHSLTFVCLLCVYSTQVHPQCQVQLPHQADRRTEGLSVHLNLAGIDSHVLRPMITAFILPGSARSASTLWCWYTTRHCLASVKITSKTAVLAGCGYHLWYGKSTP